MRNITTFILLLGLIVSKTLMAVPAKPVSRTFIQPDGSKLTIVLQGDERFSYYSTTDLVMLAKDKDGYMKYAVPGTGNEFVPGKYVARNPEERTPEVKNYIKESVESAMEVAFQKRQNSNGMNKLPGAIGSSQFPNKGNVKGLIIMAEFTDQKFSAVGTQQEFTKMMNDEGYSNYGATGSARDFFKAQSNNLFYPEFDVIGPVTLPQNMEFYGKKVGNVSDVNPTQMIVDACSLAKSQYNVDFSKYDYDNDGKVDLVYVIYAGYAEAQGAPSYTVWPHAWDIAYGNKTLVLDGKAIRNYACSSELRNASDTNIDGVGVFCHEFSHCLGLPDLYDSGGGSAYGLGYWSIMDRGCYNNESRTPPNYSAFERYSVAWLEREFLDEPQDGVTLQALSSSNKAYFIQSDQNENEYYTLENRQPEGWDKYLPGHGLMITHINYNPTNWINNTVNTTKGKERVQIVPADNVLSMNTLEGDSYPGLNGNNSFTDISYPSARLATGKFLNKPVTKITEKDGLISFNFKDYLCIPPVLKYPYDIFESGFTAEWSAVEGASSYTLEVSPITKGQLLFVEDFTNFKAGSLDAPDNTDIAGKLDDFTNVKGWSGDRVYQAGGNCLVGTAGNPGGLLITPSVDLSANNTFTLCIELKGVASSDAKLQLDWFDCADHYISLADKEINLPASFEKVYWTFSVNKAKSYLKMKANAVAYIKGITIYSGDVKNELENNSLPPFDNKESKQTITGIVSTSQKVEGLNKGTTYNYNVSSVSDNGISVPSFKKSVTTLATAIDQNLLESQVYVSGDHLYITTGEKETVQIYSAEGVLKHTFRAKEGMNAIHLEKGIYIIRIGNTTLKATVMN